MSVEWHKSICPYCGIGYGVMVGVEEGRLVRIRGMKGHPANDGDLCALAVNLPAVFVAADRLTHPMIRRDGSFVSVDWDVAISHVAGGLRRVIDDHGPGAVAFYGGAASLTEEFYLMNKLMKACIGTNNIECSTRLCMTSSAMGFLSTLGADAPPTCYADIEEADLFFIAGNNMAVSLPILFRRIRAAQRKNGAKVVVVDPRVTKTAAIADVHLQIHPGTDVALNNALAHVLLEEGFVEEDTVERNCSGLADLKELLEEYPPSRGAEITGCPEEQIRGAARIIGESTAMLTFWFQGYTHSTQAVFKCPFLFMADPGSVTFFPAEIEGLRVYLLKGGFLWADDLWGNRAWSYFETEMRRIFPEYSIEEITPEHKLFPVLYAVEEVPQIPSYQSWRRNGGQTSEFGAETAVPHLRGIFDDHGRLLVLVLVSFNTDIADGWEREGDVPYFYYTFSPQAYGLGINILIWAMSH